MAKIYGLFGSMTGKLADVVMSVRNGEQIARKYQPVVFNPQTEAQVAVRARLKLMSQLSAVFGKTIAIPREGAVSSRNLFTKVNFPLTTYVNSEADINMLGLQVTRSTVGLPPLSIQRTASNITMALSTPDRSIDRVVYLIVVRGVDEKLRMGSTVVVSNSDTGLFEATVGSAAPTASEGVFVYAYGVRDNSETARAIFGNMSSPTGEQVAELLVTRSLLNTDVTVTETRAAEGTLTQNSVSPAPSTRKSKD